MRAFTSIARIVAPTAVALAITGCAVGPNYQRPKLATPEAFRFAGGAEQAQSIADMKWWDVFEDVMLQDLIREAITNNLDLRVAAAIV